MIQKEDFWNNQINAQSVIKKKNILENRMNSFLIIEKEYLDLKELNEITNEADIKLLNELSKNTEKLKIKVKKKEFESLI